MPPRRFTDKEQMDLARIYYSKKREDSRYTMKELMEQYHVTQGAISSNIRRGCIHYLQLWNAYRHAGKYVRDMANDVDMTVDTLYNLLYTAIMRTYTMTYQEQKIMAEDLLARK